MPVIEPIKVSFGKENDEKLRTYVEDNCRALKQTHQKLFESDLPRWRKQYRGEPEQRERNFPWKNASNLVVQVTGTFVDMLLARIMSAVFEIAPLYPMQLWGQWEAPEQGEEQKLMLEEFLSTMGIDQRELDLYKHEYGVYQDAIKYGFIVCKTPWETKLEAKVIGERSGKPVATEEVVYDGPRPKKLPYESFMISSNATSLQDADFKVHIITLTKYQLEDRRYQGVYELKDSEWDTLLMSPDRSNASTTVAKDQQGEGKTTTPSGYGYGEWDMYECWFPYYHNGMRFRIIYTYHLQTRTVMRAIFNFYPDNEEPFQGARLGYGEDDIRGRGFASMLADYQEEVSTIHNQDNDAGTQANTNIYRLDPNSKLDAQFSIFPSACIPARQGEFEVFTMGRSNAADNISRQNLILEMVKDRAGVAPPMGGAGGGVVNPKRGIYSAMGTMAALQDGNRRTNLNVADFRYFHVSLGIWVLRLYAEYGIGERAKLFGNKATLLEKALDNVKKKRLGISVRAATASINKEMEKQNDMLLVNMVKQHYMWVGQLLQSLQQAPPQLQEYVTKAISAGNMLMQQIMRNFGHDDAARYIPEPKIVKELIARDGGQQQSGGGQPAAASNGTDGGNVQGQPILQAPIQAQGGDGKVVQ